MPQRLDTTWYPKGYTAKGLMVDIGLFHQEK